MTITNNVYKLKVFNLKWQYITMCIRRSLNIEFFTYSLLKRVSVWAREVEYIPRKHVACRELWLESFLVELKIEVLKPMSLMIDNKSNIDLETRFHILRDQMMKERLQVVYCPIDVQKANILTQTIRVWLFWRA